jgi:beta-glucosidase
MYQYKNPSLGIEERVKDLLSMMTVEEKFWQLFMIPGDLSDGKERYKHGIFGLDMRDNFKTKENTDQMLDYADNKIAKETAIRINEVQKYFVEETRLGIPIIPFDEALHGLMRIGSTAFPQAIGLAATFDLNLMDRIAKAIAIETKTRGLRDVLSPVINIARDARWGRVEETYGEDPVLTTKMAETYVKPFEEIGVITTPKHFAANFADGGRDSYPIHFSKLLLNEIYFPAFKRCIQEGKSTSIMTSYNSIDGDPCSSNKWMLKETLKKEWGFDGFVICDASAVGGFLDLHHTVDNREDSTKYSIEGGLDVIFQTDYTHHEPFLKAIQEGRVNMESVDDAVSRVLRAKFKLGLFENPYVNPNDAEKWNGHSDHRKLALEAAQKATILLKNKNNTLPLEKDIRSIAVIGCDAKEARLGGYSGPGINKVSILQGIKNKTSIMTNIHFTEGCGREHIKYCVIPSISLQSTNNLYGLTGEYFNNTSLQANPVLVRNDEKIDFNWSLFPPHPSLESDCFSVRWTGKIKAPESGAYEIGFEGDDGSRLYIDEELVIDNWKKQSYGIVTTTFNFQKNKVYDIKIEFYENFGNVKFKFIWNYGIPDINRKINEAVETAKKCDVSIVVCGIEEGEFRDRADIRLPGKQEEMILKIAELGRPVIVILVGGSAIEIKDWIDKVDSVIDVWYPGEEGGNGVADIIFGNYNPAGRLPITFPLTVNQLPLYYNHKPTGRSDDYYDQTGKPLFPFGFGLSYTTFEYSDITISNNKIKADENITVKCKIINTGKQSGEEVVQLYIKDITASRTRPILELKDFNRISLEPKDSKEICFRVTPEMLAMYDDNMNLFVEPGFFKIMIGSSSRDIRLIAQFEVI